MSRYDSPGRVALLLLGSVMASVALIALLTAEANKRNELGKDPEIPSGTIFSVVGGKMTKLLGLSGRRNDNASSHESLSLRKKRSVDFEGQETGSVSKLISETVINSVVENDRFRIDIPLNESDRPKQNPVEPQVVELLQNVSESKANVVVKESEHVKNPFPFVNGSVLSKNESLLNQEQNSVNYKSKHFITNKNLPVISLKDYPYKHTVSDQSVKPKDQEQTHEEHRIRHSRHRQRMIPQDPMTTPSVLPILVSVKSYSTTSPDDVIPPITPARRPIMDPSDACYGTNEVLLIIGVTCAVNFAFIFVVMALVHLCTQRKKYPTSISHESLVNSPTVRSVVPEYLATLENIGAPRRSLPHLTPAFSLEDLR